MLLATALAGLGDFTTANTAIDVEEGERSSAARPVICGDIWIFAHGRDATRTAQRTSHTFLQLTVEAQRATQDVVPHPGEEKHFWILIRYPTEESFAAPKKTPLGTVPGVAVKSARHLVTITNLPWTPIRKAQVGVVAIMDANKPIAVTPRWNWKAFHGL